MNVLSLFDGLSAGQIALNRSGIKYDKYYASEIDKYAIQICQKNYPDTIQLGDVTKWMEWSINFSKIDLLLAGFPCQAWSRAGKQEGDNDPRGALVHDLIDIWNEIKKHNPNMKFLFENVKMKQEFINYINNLFGVSPIEINSALVSAQNRKRLYWTNIPGTKKRLFSNMIEQPKDKGILLKDILEPENEIDNKYRLSKKMINFILKRDIENEGKRGRVHISGGLDKSKCLTEGKMRDSSATFICGALRGRYDKEKNINQELELRKDSKTNIITSVEKDNIICINPRKEDGTQTYQQDRIYSTDGKLPALTSQLNGRNNVGNSLTWRKLTPAECERLQTMPDNYTNGVSNSQRYKMIGNSWTVDVIYHLMQGLKKNKKSS